jgi:RimJ/RimL family protein N-acetyltransferase
MRLSNDKVMIVPFEPQLHAPLLYRCCHSGKYDLPLLSITECMNLKEAFAIVNPTNPSEVYGVVVLRNKDEISRRCEVHVFIIEEYQKNGIIQEAGKFMIYYIMNCMNYYKVIMQAREDNTAADTAIKNFGCELEGVLKHHLYSNGEFHNLKQYYMTKGMFNKRYKQVVEAETASI